MTQAISNPAQEILKPSKYVQQSVLNTYQQSELSNSVWREKFNSVSKKIFWSFIDIEIKFNSSDFFFFFFKSCKHGEDEIIQNCSGAAMIILSSCFNQYIN